MGGGSKTTTTNQNEQASTVPQTPNYALDPVKNYFGGVANYQQADPQSFVTPMNGLQQQAYSNTGGLFQAGGMYGQAANATNNVINSTPTTAQASQTQGQVGNLGPAGQATGASLLDNLQAYQNPYTQQVVDTTLAGYDQDAEMRRGQLVADGARNKAFGGSGYAFAQGSFDANLARDRAGTEAGLRANAFNTAAGLSGQDADRRQNIGMFNTGQNNQYDLSRFDAGNQMSQFNSGQANQLSQFNTGQSNDMTMQARAQQLQGAGLLGTLAGAGADTYRADLATQADMGNSLYNLQDRFTQAPLTQLQTVGNLLNPGYIDAVSGKTVTGQTSGVSKEKTSGGLLQSLLNAAATAGSAAIMASDRRAKRDIVKLGEDPDGMGAYRFNYVWDEADAKPRYGVMADEVAELRPWALGPIQGGYQTVDYLKLEAR